LLRAGQYAIAQATGVSQSVLNRFINGERGISLETAAKLCQYLDLDLASSTLTTPGGVKSSTRKTALTGVVCVSLPHATVGFLDRLTR
jgi:transcriptional regulator with XRE-family HTH domain